VRERRRVDDAPLRELGALVQHRDLERPVVQRLRWRKQPELVGADESEPAVVGGAALEEEQRLAERARRVE
jgi:hypothetical protein